jgi:NAD(P)-dependent dehydrogenase (short-subunit alcohol dehydrogenase family)
MNSQRTAVVTGGNRGIGREVCRQLAARGVRVVLTARDLGQAEETARALDRDAPGLVSALRMDATDDESVAAAFKEVAERHGAADILVNNAGIAIDGPQHRASAPDFERIHRTLDTNLFGSWRCSVAAIPAMRARGYGRIVNLTSTMASLELTTTPASPAYRISKSGLNMLTRLLAAELDGTGILVNAASPGYTRTDMSPDATRDVADGADTPVWLATLPEGGPTGGFFYDRQPLAW